MQSSIWLMLLYVLLAGSAGGVVNALMTDNGFLLPKSEKVNDKTSIFRQGYLGSVLIGALAAVVSWGLYGPLSAYYMAGTEQALRQMPLQTKSDSLWRPWWGRLLRRLRGLNRRQRHPNK